MSSAKHKELLSQSAAGWQPLRIGKREAGSPGGSPGRSGGLPRAPSRGMTGSGSDESLQTAPRRTSGSYKHVATNSLVSNSPFKRGDATVATPPTPSTSSSTASPSGSPRKGYRQHDREGSAGSIGLGIASEPPRQQGAADENRSPMLGYGFPERPGSPGKAFKPQRKGRQSMAALPNKALVSSSPFLSQSPSKSSSPFLGEDDEDQKPTAAQLAAAGRASTPPPRHQSPSTSPRRSALSTTSPSRRMTGPRLPTPDVFVKEESVEPDMTPKRKTVVFADDETLEDVYEFEAESGRDSLTSQTSSEFSEEGNSVDSQSQQAELDGQDPEDMAAIIAIQASLQSMDLSVGESHSKILRTTSAERGISNMAASPPSTSSAPPNRLAEFGLLPPEERPQPGSLSGSTGRRPLPTLPPAGPSSLRLNEIADERVPEAVEPVEERKEAAPQLSLATIATAYSLPELKDSSPLFVDVDKLGNSSPKPASLPQTSSQVSLTLKSGRPALSRETLLANRGQEPGPSTQPIAARPPLRPRVATVSDTRVPTWRSSAVQQSDDSHELHARHLDSLSSPLEKLMSQQQDTPPIGSSVEMSDADSAQGCPMSPSESLAAHRDALLRKRRDSKQARGEDTLTLPAAPPARRRSLSEGAEPINMPDSDSQQSGLSLSPSLLDVANGVSSPGMNFSESLSRDMDSVADSQGRKYRLRQHKSRSIIYGSEPGLDSFSSAGDLSPGGQRWRKISRPSEVHLNADAMRRTESSPLPLPVRPTTGRVFVKLLDATLDCLPIPRQPSYFRVVFSNQHTTLRDTPLKPLSTRVELDLEFELIKDAHLHFRIALRLDSEPFPRTGAALESKPSVLGFKKLFGSPKKARPQSMPPQSPTREPIMEFCNNEREFAISKVVWEDLQNQFPADRCQMARRDFVLPLFRASGGLSSTAVGKLRLRTFYIPSLPGVELSELPTSLDDAYADAMVAEWQDRVLHEGSLSQLGLDCSYWRRRHFQLKGQQLLAISEVTRDVKAAIDLAHATGIDDLNRPALPTTPGASEVSSATAATSSSCDDDEALTSIPFSFRLHMDDGSSVSFYADDEQSKEAWLQHLERLRGRNRPIKLWVLAYKRMQTAAAIPPPLPSKSSLASEATFSSLADTTLSEDF